MAFTPGRAAAFFFGPVSGAPRQFPVPGRRPGGRVFLGFSGAHAELPRMLSIRQVKRSPSKTE